MRIAAGARARKIEVRERPPMATPRGHSQVDFAVMVYFLTCYIYGLEKIDCLVTY